MKNLNQYLIERLKLNKDTKIFKISLTNEELQNLYDVLGDFYNYAYSDLFENQSDRDEAMKCWKNRKPYGFGKEAKTFDEDFRNIISFIIDNADDFGEDGLMKSLRNVDKIMNCEQIDDIIDYFIKLL